jgi:hypothetical protein
VQWHATIIVLRKRVFKVKTFSRWARTILGDRELCEAAREIAAGRFEADLGGGVCKKRIAPAGRGKRGATRALVSWQGALAIFYLTGRQKSDPGADFSDRELALVKLVAKGLQASDLAGLEVLKAAGAIEEICDEQGKQVGIRPGRQ